jgi:hypothetical protein
LTCSCNFSQSTNYTEYVTNTVVERSGPRTNRVYTTNYIIVTNIVSKADQKNVTSRDVIAAIDSNAPPHSTLALVTGPSGSNSVVLLVDNTNYLTVSNLTISVLNTVYAGTQVLTSNSDRFASYRDFPQQTQLITAILDTPTLSFSVTDVAQSNPNHDHGFGFGGGNWGGNGDAGSAVGSGSDSLGTNEIVFGSIILR